MANKRVLELAKELKVDVAEVQRAAIKCSVAITGPTSMLNDEDTGKIKASLKDSSNGKSGGVTKTLTLNRPMLAGQSSGGSSVEGRGHSVQVAVRRRRPTGPVPPVAKPVAKPPVAKAKPVAQPKPPASPVAKSHDKPKPAQKVVAKGLSPAQRAAKALADMKEKTAAAKAQAKQNKPQAKRFGKQEQKPATQPSSAASGGDRRPSGDRRPAGDRRPTSDRRPAGDRRPAPGDRRPGGDRKPGSGGPRTTIRRGLTPAQIAASKAPRSSLKQIEEKITSDRNNQRRNRAAGDRKPRPAGDRPPGGPRRAPSVAVSPEPTTAPPGGQKRRFAGRGGPQQQRRLSPAEKAAKRAYSSKRNVVMTEEQEERMARLAKGDRRRGMKFISKDDEEFVKREVEINDPMLVSELASRMAIKSVEVLKKLLELGMPTTITESLDADTSTLIVEEFGHTPKVINAAAAEDALVEVMEDEQDDDLQPRPPVVVVMGHVDHGKTSILDALRKAHVAEGEAGGITQHIGAYMVKLDAGERVVFIDTPGHEAFTGLRARGAKMTDVAVLVVAANDGVKPQTVEALNHARSAGVPLIVAVNKMDVEGADPEMVKRQLSEHEVISEDWGGDTIFVNVSAKTGEGLNELLEMLALQTEILELKANPERRGSGIVVESRLDKGRGPVATVLVQNGTFKKGDTVVVGAVTGRIRAIVDENNVQHKTAGPSTPFELLGLEEVPQAGEEIGVVDNDRQAREIISYRKEKVRQQGLNVQKTSMEDLFAAVQSGVAEVPVLIKGDVTGSLEAMADSLAKAGTDDVQVKVIHKAIGGITESDIMLASAADAIVIGFNVRPETKAKKLAAREGVDVRFYKVIYDAIDDIRDAMAGKLSPDKIEKVIGSAEVRETFGVPKIGTVAGCYMIDGFVTRTSQVRVLREGVLIYDGVLASLKRFKDDVKEVKTGFEFGMGVENFNDVKVGDSFEFYIIEEVAAKL